MTDEAKKYTAADFSPGDKVVMRLPTGKNVEDVVKQNSTPYMLMQSGRKARPGSCRPA